MKTLLFVLISGLLLSTGALADDIEQTTPDQLLNGPTLQLNYNTDPKKNPVDCFMYFIPLTSPTSVTVETAEDTTFTATLTSWKSKRVRNTVFVECDFKVVGKGDYSVHYDPNEMINLALDGKEDKKLKEIDTLLEWIRLDGPCLGHIKAIGTVSDKHVQMDSIDVSFNRDDSKSPVQVSIYDIKKKDGEFTFENRTNCQIARINSLKFQRTDDDKSPRMSVELASLAKDDGEEGFLSRLTAMVANILQTSTPVSTVGNETMLEFGLALYEKQEAFIFPLASNVNVKEGI